MELGGHAVHSGRPDLAKLIREGAEEARARGKSELVVAACGPEALVEAVKRAVTGNENKIEGVALQFSGAESHW